MTQPYDVTGATPHDPNDWTWHDLGSNGGYWTLWTTPVTPADRLLNR